MNENDDWVYESPDGGLTVYRRRPGEIERTPIEVVKTESIDAWTHRRSLAVRRMRWYRMLEAAQHDGVLEEMITRAEVWWELKHAP